MKRVYSTLLSRVRSRTLRQGFLHPAVLSSQVLVTRFAAALRCNDGDLQELYFQKYPGAARLIRAADATDAEAVGIECQYLAIALLFHAAYCAATRDSPKIVFAKDAREYARELMRDAEACERLGDRLIERDLFDELGRSLFTRAEELRSKAKGMVQSLSRNRSTGVRDLYRAYAIVLCRNMVDVFGHEMSGLVALIVNCVFPEAAETARSIKAIYRATSTPPINGQF